MVSHFCAEIRLSEKIPENTAKFLLLIPMYKPFPQNTAREGLHIDISNVKHN
jgi:hypothetical protein